MIWYIPSFYGDIRLERIAGKKTRVRYENVTELEKKALGALWKHAAKKDWVDLTSPSMSPPVDLAAPIEKVQKILAKSLKPDRKLLSVVQFSSGKMQEIGEATFVEIEQEEKGIIRRALTCALPDLGCPIPEFKRAEIAARSVLDAFLSEEQRYAFSKKNRFIACGAATGRRYLISSRFALTERFNRSLYDIDENLGICTHDYSVPAAEEMLALLAMVSLPGRELQIREARGME